MQISKIRLDKWLWAARFFKTRGLAVDAITGGKVHLNGQRAKPAKEVHVNDELTIRTGHIERTVVVCALSSQRRPAVEAALLYQETPKSIARREQTAVLRRQAVALRSPGMGRPTKKARRSLESFIKKK